MEWLELSSCDPEGTCLNIAVSLVKEYTRAILGYAQNIATAFRSPIFSH